MSTRDLNWLKFGGLVALAFSLGLFVAGLLDFPRTGMAQNGAQGRPPLIKVEAPRLPSVKTLSDVSDAFASIVEAVRPSVVYVEVDRPADGPAAGVGADASRPRCSRARCRAVGSRSSIAAARGSLCRVTATS